MLLKESYDIKVGYFNTKAGKQQKIIYVSPASSDKVFPIKDELKKFGAKWMNSVGVWGWFYNDQSVDYTMEKFVKPAVQYLTSVETEKRKAEDVIDEILTAIQNDGDIDINTQAEIKDKLEQFKYELVNELSSDEFFAKMQSIIDFGRHQGHQYSFMNTLLIFIQDPQATAVKSASGWEKYNRTVKPGSKPIYLIVPKGQKHYSQEYKEELKRRFIANAGVSDESQLTPGEKERLNILLRGYGAKSFDYKPNFYDIRFTEPIEGKEDIWQQEQDAKPNVPWFDGTSEATEETEKLSNAMMNVIRKYGVELEMVDDLDGARGASMSGKIEVLSNAPHNKGFFKTLVHEFSHELLHQTYLKSHDPELKQYFVGKENGRAAVEQQAETSAWIVLRSFGYEMPTSINYIGMWGLRKDKAVEVFDSVARVATIIIKGLNEELNGMNESKERINEITGLEVASMLGCEDIYLNGKKKQNKIQLSQEDVREMVVRAVSQILESKSKKGKSGLEKFFEKHGIEPQESSIGFSEKEQKWYGWSHRAIYGFGIGSKVKKGSCAYNGKEWTAKTLNDAKQMAIDYQKGVS